MTPNQGSAPIFDSPVELSADERATAAGLDRDRPVSSQPYYFDRRGRSISFGTWVMLFEHHHDYRQVAKTGLPGGIRVSTIWLGLDHGFGARCEIFETMIFGAEGEDEPQWRYGTEAEALAGHARAVELARGLAPAAER